MKSIKRFIVNLFAPRQPDHPSAAAKPKSSEAYRAELEEEKLRPANRGF